MYFRDYSEIVFSGGDILSAEMLDETYRYPREFLHVYHAGCPDGIISGLDFIDREDGVYLTAGIVKASGRYYILPEEMNMTVWLQQLKTSRQLSIEYFLCLVPEPVSAPAGIGIQSRSRLKMTAERIRPERALLLGRYKPLGDKIELPQLHIEKNEPFADFFQARYLQLLESEYAHPQGGTTYHPLLFRAVQSYLLQKKQLSPYDFTLLSEIQNHGITALSTLKAYVAVNQKKTPVSLEITREKLFAELTKCLQIPYCMAVHQESVSSRKDRKAEIKRHNKLL